MLLSNDGLDVPVWDEGVDWEHLDGLLGVATRDVNDDTEPDLDEEADSAQVAPGNRWGGLNRGSQPRYVLTANSDWAHTGPVFGSGQRTGEEEHESTWCELQMKLVSHFDYMWANQHVHWARGVAV